MDEKYLIMIYNDFGGESVFGSLDDFKNAMSTNADYRKIIYNDFGGEPVFGSFDDFSYAAGAQTTTVQPELTPKKKGESTESGLDAFSSESLLGDFGQFDSQLPEQPIQPSLEETPFSLEYEAKKEKEVKSPFKQPGNVDFLQPSLNTITPDLMNQGAESVKKELDYQFKDAGFEFTPVKRYGFEDILVKAPDGNTKLFSLGSGNLQNTTKEIKDFISQKSSTIPNISKIEKMYLEENKKFTTQKQYDDEVKAINEQAESFKNEMKI